MPEAHRGSRTRLKTEKANRADQRVEQPCPVWPPTHRPQSCLELSPPRGSVPVWGPALARPLGFRQADPIHWPTLPLPCTRGHPLALTLRPFRRGPLGPVTWSSV